MWYLITGFVCVFLIWSDSRKRNAAFAKYALLSIIIPPIGYGLWQASKPLVGEEKRYGGKGWNVMKWVGIMHTVLCVVWALYGMFQGAGITSAAETDAEKTGAAIGTGIGIMLVGVVWFFGVAGTLIIGFLLKKPITEERS